jgi:hypothetical protein
MRLLEYFLYAVGTFLVGWFSLRVFVHPAWPERTKTNFSIGLTVLLFIGFAVYRLTTGEDATDRIQAVIFCSVYSFSHCPQAKDNQTPPAAHPVASGSGSEEEEERLIATIEPLYDPYFIPSQRPPAFIWRVPWSASMTALMKQVDACQKRTRDAIIEYDPITASQDPSITNLNVIVEIVPEDQRAGVLARFKNGGQPTFVHYAMIEEQGQWKVDDIHSSVGGEANFRASMTQGLKYC